MSVISGEEIRRRLILPSSEPQSLIVSPLLLEDKAVDLDSLDLRLGTRFLIPQVPPQPFLEPKKPYRAHQPLHIPLGKYLVVPAHQTVLGVTLEFVKLPFDLSGEILTKSSVARTFMVIETAPWIHPLYRGCLTLEIANVSNTPLLLYPGRTIGQLILMNVEKPAQPSRLRGAFIGPVVPETPNPVEVEKELQRIGYRGKVSHPCN